MGDNCHGKDSLLLTVPQEPRAPHATQDHKGRHRSCGRQREWEEDMGKKPYCGLHGKEQVRQGKQPQGWLACLTSAGAGALGLSLDVWHLALGCLGQGASAQGVRAHKGSVWG